MKEVEQRGCLTRTAYFVFGICPALRPSHPCMYTCLCGSKWFLLQVICRSAKHQRRWISNTLLSTPYPAVTPVCTLVAVAASK